MTALLFYAELLPNIRSISLSIVPPTAPNESTRAVVPPGASHLNLYHNDETTTIKLPADSNPSEQTIVVKPRLGEDSFSCRLPVASSPESSTENIAPWSAPELTKESSVSMLCGSCHNPIFTPNTIKTWKDLPSENWADMMDFWHCHKPHEKNGNNEASVTEDTGKYSSFGKGYSASPGTALVDRGYFLFHQQDVEQSIRVCFSSMFPLLLDCVEGAVSARGSVSGSKTQGIKKVIDQHASFDASQWLDQPIQLPESEAASRRVHTAHVLYDVSSHVHTC